MKHMLDVAVIIAIWCAGLMAVGITLRIMAIFFMIGWNTIP